MRLRKSSERREWLPPERRHMEPLKFQPAVAPLVRVRANEKREQGARQRIKNALDSLNKLNRAFTTVELHEAAGCSRRTLYAHQDIWRDIYESRKDYRDLACGFFANCTGEYNVVVGAAASNSKPPDHSAQNLTPPGLLACRQIASELSMRAQHNKLQQEKDQRKSSSWRKPAGGLVLPKRLRRSTRTLLSLRRCGLF